MKINPTLQRQIVDELYAEQQKKVSQHKTCNNHQIQIMTRGIILGIDLAMELINGWNKPNHGRVTAQINKEKA